MGKRSKNAKRCERCRMHEQQCLCEHIPRLDLGTRLALVMHYREQQKTTATGPLAVEALVNSELYLHGKRDAALDLSHLTQQDRRLLLLFPSEGARPLTRALIEEQPHPVTLVVPDGNWGQARRVPKRVPGLEHVEHVTLAPGPPSRWGLRREPLPEGLATFEAIARAFGVLESPNVQEQLEALFERMVNLTFAARGYDKQGVAVAGEAAHGQRSVADDAAPLEDLQILHHDEHLVAVNKPSGLLVHRGWARDGVPALQRVRDQIGKYVYPVHRLDRATSGVLLFALKPEVARDMQMLFESEAVQKRYLALCRGCDASLQCVDHALAKEKGAPPRPARTLLRLLGKFERYGLYEARPQTGRTHQIRRHLKHVSHPIIGDIRYGKGEHNRLFRERFGFHRLALHCHRMEFEHPRGGGRISIEAALSDDFDALLGELGLRGAI